MSHHHPQHHHHHHHQSIQPKERSFTANSGTKAAVLLKGRSSTANSGTQAVVLLEIDRCGSFPLFPHSTLSLAPEQTLKDLKRSQMHRRSVKVRRVDMANWALRTSLKFTTGVKYQFHQSFDQIRDLEIPITLRPHSNVYCL